MNNIRSSYVLSYSGSFKKILKIVRIWGTGSKSMKTITDNFYQECDLISIRASHLYTLSQWCTFFAQDHDWIPLLRGVAWRMVRNPLDLIYDNPYTHTSIHTNRVIKYLPWQVFYLSLSLPLKLKILQFNLINKKNYTKKNLRILVCFTWLKFVWDGKFTLFYLLNTVSGKKILHFFLFFLLFPVHIIGTGDVTRR